MKYFWSSLNVPSSLISISSFGAAIFSSLNIYFLQSSTTKLRRKVSYKNEDLYDDYINTYQQDSNKNDQNSLSKDYFIERDLNDPPPTVEVPYRIRKSENFNNEDSLGTELDSDYGVQYRQEKIPLTHNSETMDVFSKQKGLDIEQEWGDDINEGW